MNANRETYNAMKKRHEDEVNAFPYMWAFNKEQFEEGMKRLGLEVTDTNKIVSIGCGGYLRKSDYGQMLKMHKRLSAELREAIYGDEKFAYEAFRRELANHEYVVTYDPECALRCLGLTWGDVIGNEMLKRAFKAAEKDYLASVE